MRSVKKMTALLLVAAFCLSLAACAKKSEAAPAPTAAPAPAETAAPAEPAAPAGVAAVLGDYTVPVSEVEADYAYFMSYMSYYGMEAPTDPSEIAEYVQMVVDTKINDLAPAWQADKQGLKLTAEEEAEIDAAVKEQHDGIFDSYKEGAAEELGEGATEEQINEKANALLEKDVQEYMGCDFASYMANYRTSLVIAAKAKLLEKTVKEGVTLGETDVADWYTAQVAADKAAAEEDVFSFRTKQVSFEKHESDVPALFAPEGFVRVQIIKVSMSDEDATAFAANRTKMGELEAEFGKLELNKEDAARRAKIRTEYKDLLAANGQIASDTVKKADAIHEELMTSNMIFAAVNKKYNESLDEEAAENGILIYTAGEDGEYPAALREAAAALGDGDISGVIEADGVYYILRRVGAVKQGAVALEEIKDIAETQALLSKQESVWTETSATYNSDAAVAAVKYPENYAKIGLN